MKKFTVSILVIVVIATISVAFGQQAHDRNLPPNVPPNPHWTIAKWGDLPAGMSWLTLKEVHSVGYDPNGKGSILVLVTGPNPSDPPVWVFGLDGKFQKAWGANLFGGPHSVNVDRFGYIWITDNVDNIVGKFTEDGKLLMMLGKRELPATTPRTTPLTDRVTSSPPPTAISSSPTAIATRAS